LSLFRCALICITRTGVADLDDETWALATDDLHAAREDSALRCINRGRSDARMLFSCSLFSSRPAPLPGPSIDFGGRSSRRTGRRAQAAAGELFRLQPARTLPAVRSGRRGTGRIDPLVGRRRSVRRLEPLYRTGDPFESLYAVRAGFFKTCVTGESGRDQVTGFQMAGELLGFDGIGTELHTCDAIALEDSQVCVIWFDHLEALSRDSPELQHQIHKIMSREIVREHGVMLLLGGMRAEERLASFLLDLLERLRLRGFSGRRCCCA
jgi:CRP-like cAMP-binding protein